MADNVANNYFVISMISKVAPVTINNLCCFITLQSANFRVTIVISGRDRERAKVDRLTQWLTIFLLFVLYLGVEGYSICLN